MNYALLKELIEQTEAFERDTPARDGQTLADFAVWLRDRYTPSIEPKPVSSNPLLATAGSPETEIGVLVSYMYRYAKLYSKKALADTPLASIDEFSYMVPLLRDTPPTKTELIEQNIHEKTTGTEILRRLINNGFIEQFDDATDRRAKRLRLTPQGMAVMQQVMPRMAQIAMLIGGELTQAEKIQLVGLLKKLHLFHNIIFKNERSIPVEELAERIR